MGFRHSKLKNQLNVLTFKMPYVNSVAISIVVKVGSRYENINDSGIIHAIEHMMFKGTKTRSANDIAIEFDAIGGNFNAYTSKEQTVYHAKLLKENLHTGLEIIADIFLNSLFNEEEMKKEIRVIEQEIANAEDSPEDFVYQKFYSTIYPNQALGRPIAGTLETIKKINRDSIISYIDKYYVTDNIFISVAGNIEHAEIVSLIEDLFSGLKNTNISYVYEGAKYHGISKFFKKDIEQTHVILGFESFPYTNLKKFYQVNILSMIMGGGMSSRLFQSIRENLGIAYHISAHSSSYFDTGIFDIYASIDDKNFDQLIKQLILEIKKILNNIPEEELNRAKTQIKANICMAEEVTEYKAEEVAKSFALFGKYFSLSEVLDILNEINIKDMREISTEVFSSNLSLIVSGQSEIDVLNYSDNIRKKIH